MLRSTRLFRRLLSVALAVLLVLFGLAASAAAESRRQPPFRLIRDAEIERTIRSYATPIFNASGLAADDVKVYLINDDRLNAFVAGGQNIFINTGLLIRAKDASQVIGVIAHECGHITGGHLVRLRAAVREAQIKQVIAFILGAGAAVAARDPRAGAATISLGTKMAEGTFLKYSRAQERSADQHAVTAMDQAGISSRGLLAFMQVIQDQELLISARQDPYVRSHPVTSERIEFLREHVAHSPMSDRPLPARFVEMHQRLRAKLIGFLNPTDEVFRIYKPTDNSLASRYARAVARHRLSQTDKAIALVDSLIKERPHDPFFHELKGQISFESGRIPEAVVAYRKAVQYAPNEPLIRVGFAQALLAVGGEAQLREALTNFRVAVRSDENNPLAWRLLGITYGKLGRIGEASWALAEYGLLIGDKRQVWGNIGRAERLLKRGSPAWLRIQDIKRAVGKWDGDREGGERPRRR
jgi:predicted Zn-dependent protease